MTKTQKRLSEANGTLRAAFEAAVTRRIRLRYSLSAELSVQRQRDTRPEEFREMNDYITACIREAREEIYGGDGIDA